MEFLSLILSITLIYIILNSNLKNNKRYIILSIILLISSATASFYKRNNNEQKLASYSKFMNIGCSETIVEGMLIKTCNFNNKSCSFFNNKLIECERN